MAIRHIPLAEATPEQVFEFARTFLNLEVTGADSADSVSAKIQTAAPNTTMIFVNEPDSVAEVAASEVAEVELRPEENTGRSTGTLGKGDPRAIIMIPIVETEDGSGARDVLVGVNGRAWQLKRGVDLPVPFRVVRALQAAKANIIRHSQEEGKEGDVISHEAMRFNFNMVEGPSQAEIEEWDRRVGAEFCA